MNTDTQMCTPHNLTLLASYLDQCPEGEQLTPQDPGADTSGVGELQQLDTAS